MEKSIFSVVAISLAIIFFICGVLWETSTTEICILNTVNLTNNVLCTSISNNEEISEWIAKQS